MLISLSPLRLVALLVLGTGPACAGDLATLALPEMPAWSGAYVGGHFGYGTGGLGGATTAQLDQSVVFPPSITGLIGGYQLGYNTQLRNRLVLGLEADVAFPSPIDLPANHPAALTTSVEYVGTVRGRIGFAAGRVMPFVTGGFAWGRTNTDAIATSGTQRSSSPVTHTGWTLGAGAEARLAGPWTAKSEYDRIALARAFPGVAVQPDINLFKLGLNYQFGDNGRSAEPSAPGWPPETDLKSWNFHAQSTLVAQGYPAFRSAYQGPNSLPAGGQTRETWTATAFAGVRLAKGLELYFDPELDQGGGLAKTVGIAGFPNGEAQKGGSEFPKFRAQRYFVRQTIGLGGAQEKIEDGPNQLAGSVDINRLTLTAGRFAIGDYFDANSYAHDPRTDFLNWSLWEAAAYDFPADLPGFTRGVVAELNRKDWTLRGGFVQVPGAPNSDILTFKTGGAIAELEQRYTLAGQGGKLRLGAFANRGFTGNYQMALAAVAVTPALDATSALVNTRQDRLKYGFYANVEQTLTADFGLYGRASWNDGRNESLSFTDVDTSLSAGLALKGTAWGRANDTVGLGAAINGISTTHRAYLAAGGTGLFIGDGALNYRTEKILETYYALNLAKGKTLTTDYQFVANPAYNADRGPVSIVATRLHVEF